MASTKKKRHAQVTCNCTEYPFPHRIGSGKCDNESIEGPFCEECKKTVSPIAADFGIGAYEYWGSKGVDRDVQVVSPCCHASVYHDITCNSLFTMSDFVESNSDY